MISVLYSWYYWYFQNKFSSTLHYDCSFTLGQEKNDVAKNHLGLSVLFVLHLFMQICIQIYIYLLSWNYHSSTVIVIVGLLKLHKKSVFNLQKYSKNTKSSLDYFMMYETQFHIFNYILILWYYKYI